MTRSEVPFHDKVIVHRAVEEAGDGPGRGAMVELARGRWASVRAPRPDVRLDLYGVLGAATLAVVAYVAALWMQAPPAPGFAVVMFAAAPLLAAVAAPIILARARAEDDERLGWFGSGLLVSLAGMVLQLISFSAVTGGGGGPLRTGDTASSQLYLLYHAAPAVAVFAAVAGWGSTGRRVFLAAGLSLAVVTALNLVPSPELLRPDLTFTRVFVAAEVVVATGLGVAARVWIREVGRSVRPLRAWAGVALMLCCYDVVLNAVAAERFQPVWWASLSLRVATYAVLAVGAVTGVLVALRRLEDYTDVELDRSDADLRRSMNTTTQLLASAEAMSRATTIRDVAETLVLFCQSTTGLPRAAAAVLDESSGRLRTVARSGYDKQSQRRLQEYLPTDLAMPGTVALQERRPVFLGNGTDLDRQFPGMRQLSAHRGTRALAVLPLMSAGSPVGLLTVSGDDPRDWHPAERELLGGLAAQAGQALQRAVLFERHRSTAELLQQGLLPQRLSPVPGVALAARYLAGAAGTRVGGDWYDCLPLPDGRAALVVGDVMGKGIAAAARMGQVRQAVRVLASIDPAPSAVLTALDRLPEDVDEDQLITLVYVLLDPAEGLARISRAGHLPPILASQGRPAVLVEGGSSPPLGVPRTTRPEVTITLPPGSTLVLFTDGLVEDRRTGLDFGLPAVVEAVSTLAAGRPDVDGLADAILAAMKHPGPPSDDTCLLVAQLDDPLAVRG